MSRNDLMVTVVGWAATKPKEVTGGVPFTSFRLATTPRYFDNRQGGWADGRTEWLTVKVFRDVALNVASSINKGDPVLVHGRLRTEEWQGDGGLRTTLVVEASALGHDLTRGRSVFVRTVRTSRPEDADAAPGAGEFATASGGPEVDPWALDARPDSEPDAGPDSELGLEPTGITVGESEALAEKVAVLTP
jgi:single-strand DNA-binding protein